MLSQHYWSFSSYRKSNKNSSEADAEENLTSSVSLSINSSASRSTEEEEIKADASVFEYNVVLVVSFNGANYVETPGLLSEEKVISSIQVSCINYNINRTKFLNISIKFI